MLSAYIMAAMHRATYELLPDDEGFAGVIPGLQGVLGHAATLEACRDDLQSALEDWIWRSEEASCRERVSTPV